MSVTTLTILGILIFGDLTDKIANVYDIVTIVFFVLTAMTTVSSTVFICQHIKTSISKTHHTQRYQKIIYISINSSVIYSIASVFNVIGYIVIPMTSTNVLSVYGFTSYVPALTTVMTACVFNQFQ